MRKGIAISAAAHVVIAAAAVVFAGPTPFEVEPEEGIQVELVAPDEAAKDEAKPQDPTEPQVAEKPEAKLDLSDALKTDPGRAASKPAGDPAAEPSKTEPSKTEPSKTEPEEPAKESGPPPQQQQASPLQAPPPEPAQASPPVPPAPGESPSPEPAAEVPPPFAPEMMTQMAKLSRPGAFDDAATEKAKLEADEIAAFKAAVRKCWVPPAAPADAKLQVVIRVSFKRNGALAGEPMLTAVRPASSKSGPALMRAAQDAVRHCQPYAVLPPAKFQEWRVLDLPFSLEGPSGG